MTVNDLKQELYEILRQGNVIKARSIFLDAYRMKRHLISELEFISLHENIYKTFGVVL